MFTVHVNRRCSLQSTKKNYFVGYQSPQIKQYDKEMCHIIHTHSAYENKRPKTRIIFRNRRNEKVS
jgi:hypothetical protein